MNHKQELPWSLVRVVMDGSRLPESRLTVRDLKAGEVFALWGYGF